jgi:hypothetical protein
MNWEALGALGQIAGSLVVALTLIFLAIQIRQSNRSNRAALSWSMNQALADLNGRISSDAELAEIWIRGCKNWGALTPVERERFAMYAFDRLNLAVYAEGIINRDGLIGVHIDYVEWLIGLLERAPGLQDFFGSVEGGLLLPSSLSEKIRRRSSDMADRMKLGGGS